MAKSREPSLEDLDQVDAPKAEEAKEEPKLVEVIPLVDQPDGKTKSLGNSEYVAVGEATRMVRAGSHRALVKLRKVIEEDRDNNIQARVDESTEILGEGIVPDEWLQ